VVNWCIETKNLKVAYQATRLTSNTSRITKPERISLNQTHFEMVNKPK